MPNPIWATTVIEHHGITWTLEEDLSKAQQGVFANGDPWVVGPVTVVSITPAASAGKHGSMLNPLPNVSAQGFDNAMQRIPYDATLDVATQLPLRLSPGSSLLSSKSNASAEGDASMLHQIEVLTVLANPAATGDFRPPYAGTDKSLRWNITDLNLKLLRQLPASKLDIPLPSKTSLENTFAHPWIELKTNWVGRYYHPDLNYPFGNYGREIAKSAGNALLWLQLDFSEQEKMPILIGALQAGIDIYGAASYGAVWGADGGHNQGRKTLLLLAGMLFNDSNLLSYADGNRLVFQEDQQTFRVSQTEVDNTHSPDWVPDSRKPALPYTTSDIGLAEWGIRHSSRPFSDNKHWEAIYRQVSGSATFPHFVVAKLMGMETLWNHEPFFAYYPRYFESEWPVGTGYGAGVNAIGNFPAAMYEAFVLNSEPLPELPAAPEYSPSGGSYLSEQLVTIQSPTPSATIYYTLDGSAPDATSATYTQPIAINESLRLRAIAMHNGAASDITEQQYTILSVAPFTSSEDWQNASIGFRDQNFRLTTTVMPLLNPQDSVIGFSLGNIDNQTSYSGLATLVRFNSNGEIDIRDGDLYHSLEVLPYTKREQYQITIDIFLDTQQYSVMVRELSSGNSLLLADHFQFRSEQASLTAVDTFAFKSLGAGTLQINAISIDDDHLGSLSAPQAPTTLQVKILTEDSQ
ncbi:chitobiase/beta-hexosaminidase C-terminal domain-containing protein [Gynuella sp.]|uniref:chitobiase/beta-hexosaminidase C-terminal domain-containing protein n=1 Tax=Gynuella sp. TaxID=2969146 RepID=UPI003D0D8135